MVVSDSEGSVSLHKRLLNREVGGHACRSAPVTVYRHLTDWAAATHCGVGPSTHGTLYLDVLVSGPALPCVTAFLRVMVPCADSAHRCRFA